MFGETITLDYGRLSNSFDILFFDLDFYISPFFFWAWQKNKLFLRTINGIKNQNNQHIGSDILFEARVSTKNNYRSPVLDVPMAGGFWEIIERRGKTRYVLAKGAIGNRVELNNLDGGVFHLELDSDCFAFRTSKIFRMPTNINSFISKKTAYPPEIARRLLTFCKSHHVDIDGAFGITIKEYLLENERTYTILGTLQTEGKVIGSNDKPIVINECSARHFLRRTRLNMILVYVAAIFSVSLPLIFVKT